MSTADQIGYSGFPGLPGPSPYGMPCQIPPDWWQSDVANMDTYAYWRDLLVETAITSIKWVNLPDGIDSRFIEMTFLFQGMGGFFEKIPGQIAFSSGAVIGNPDMYMNPESVSYVSVNGSGTWTRRTRQRVSVLDDGRIDVEEPDATWSYDNNLRIPLMWHVDLYARRLARIDRLIDVNLAAQATPWIGECDEEGKGDIIRAIRQLTGIEPVIVTGQGLLSSDNLHIMQTGAPFVVDKLQDARARELNLAYTLLGVDNGFSVKREREINSEVDSNNEQIMLLRESRMQGRKRLCEETNALFGTDIDVHWNVAHDDDGRVDMGDDTIEGMRLNGDDT